MDWYLVRTKPLKEQQLHHRLAAILPEVFLPMLEARGQDEVVDHSPLPGLFPLERAETRRSESTNQCMSETSADFRLSSQLRSASGPNGRAKNGNRDFALRIALHALESVFSATTYLEMTSLWRAFR
jgi:hypothetical protein